MMTTRRRRSFSPEFKAQTVELVRTSGKSVAPTSNGALLQLPSPPNQTLHQTGVSPRLYSPDQGGWVRR